MFARFRNIFGKSKADEVPTIVVDEAPAEESLDVNQHTNAPLASEEEDLSNGHEQPLSASTQELSQQLDAINLSSQLPDFSSDDTEQDEPKDEDDEDDDETASTSSVKTKIAKASIERDIILEDALEEEEEEEDGSPEQPGQNSLDKIKALIRNDSETYPQSDYTDTDEPSPLHSRTASVDSTAEAVQQQQQQQLSKPNLFSCDYSVVPDELPLDSSPSPMHDSGRNSSAGSESIHVETPATLTVTPTGSNDLACAAISHKLSAIAEVAESLDAVIRDCSGAELDLSNATHKKLGMGNEVSAAGSCFRLCFSRLLLHLVFI